MKKVESAVMAFENLPINKTGVFNGSIDHHRSG